MAFKLTLVWSHCDPEVYAAVGGWERLAAGEREVGYEVRGEESLQGGKDCEGHWGPPSGQRAPEGMWLCPASHIPTVSLMYTHIIFCSSVP